MMQVSEFAPARVDMILQKPIDAIGAYKGALGRPKYIFELYKTCHLKSRSVFAFIVVARNLIGSQDKKFANLFGFAVLV
jgi:hypothetical protein